MILEDLYRLLEGQHVRAQGIVDTMTQPVVVLDRNLCVTTANNAFLKTFKVERDDVLGESLFELGNGQWEIPELRHLIEAIIPKAAAVVAYEVKHEFPTIGPRTFLVDARRLLNSDDTSNNILVLFEDVTERQRHDAEQEFIVAETRHRMKNLAAVVRAIAMQTKAHDPAAAEYRDAFLARLDAALQAQEVAVSHETIDLETLLQEAIGKLGVGRLYATGPTVELVGKRIIFAASMIFHELATNAAKHGALSVAKGTIDVRWLLEPGAGDRQWLNCTWREANGPKITPPSLKGYGTELIEGTSAQAGGTVKLKYDPGGLVASISLPL